jgi:hypothetical protein
MTIVKSFAIMALLLGNTLLAVAQNGPATGGEQWWRDWQPCQYGDHPDRE